MTLNININNAKFLLVLVLATGNFLQGKTRVTTSAFQIPVTSRRTASRTRPLFVATTLPTVSDAADVHSVPSIEEPTVQNTRTTTATGEVNLISSMGELFDFIDSDSQQAQTLSSPPKLKIVKYYASYCKICQRAGIQLKGIAKDYATNGQPVEFAKVEAQVFNPEPSDKLKALGVSKFPFVQIYRGGLCVASFSTGPTHMFKKRVLETIDTCLSRSDTEWNQFAQEFHKEIESNSQARNELSLQVRNQPRP